MHVNGICPCLRRTIWGVLIILLFWFHPAWADTTVIGTISLDTTWDLAGSPYIVSGIVYVRGTDGPDTVTTLTIEPGVEVRFNSGARIEVGYTSGSSGALIAQGTTAAPVRFVANVAEPPTSFRAGIRFLATSHDETSRLAHCIMDYVYAEVNNAAPAIESCQFTANYTYDLTYYNTVGGSVAGCTFNHGIYYSGTGEVSFSGNTVNWDNNYSVSMGLENVESFLADTTFTNLDESSALEVTGNYLTKDATWNASIPLYIASYLYIFGTDGPDGITTLTLQPGTELRIRSRTSIFVGYGDPGALVAQGTPLAPIRFTAPPHSLYPGAWGRILFGNETGGAASKLEYCIIEYGGGNGQGNIAIDWCSPAIRYCTIRNSQNDGIYVSGTGANPIISCNNIRDNIIGIYTTFEAQPVISNNNFTNNQDNGIYNDDSSIQVSAINNWWGDAGGPGQSGDSVYGNVSYDPWRTTVSDCAPSLGQNDPPFVPQNPFPGDGDTGIPFPNLNITLSWNGGDPNATDTISYELMWGTAADNLASLAANQSDTHYSVADIQPNTTYYWQVIARDNFGAQTDGPVWHFTTADPQPDLVVSDLTWTPTTGILAGDQVTFTATLQNIGSGPTVNDFAVAFQINGMRSTVWITQSLPAGQSVNVEHVWVALYGSASVAVDVDSTLTLTEDNEANNNYSADLGMVADVNPPVMTSTAPADGTSVLEADQITIDLEDPFGGVNTEATAAAISVTLNGSQVVNGTVNVSGNRFIFSPAVSPLPDGQYQVSLTAYDIAGNSQAYTFSFIVDSRKPDLVVSNLIWAPSSNIEAGEQVAFTATIQNDGAVPVTNDFGVAFRINGSTLSSQWVADDLAQGASIQLTFNYIAQIGPLAIEVIADSTSAVIEEDESNNGFSADLGTIPDTTPPQMSWTNPADGALLQQVDRIDIYLTDQYGGSVDWGATEPTVHVAGDGGLQITGSVSRSGAQMMFTPSTVPLPDGSYQVSFTAFDTAGNFQAYAFSFTVDDKDPLPPVITGSSVTSGIIQVRPIQNKSNKNVITLTGTREDNTLILINGSQRVSMGSGDWTASVGLVQGDNAVQVSCRDMAGNTSEPVWVDIYVDSVSPAVTAISPAANSFINTASTVVLIDFIEATSGLDIASSNLTIKDGNMTPVQGSWAENNGRLQFTPPVGFADGTYTLEVRLVDKLGNASPAMQSVFVIDTTAPPAPQIDPVVSPTHTVTQTISGHKEAFAAVLLNGQIVVDHTNQVLWQHSVTLTSGDNQFSFSAQDRAGNQSDAVQVGIYFDDIAPPPVTVLTANGEGNGTSVLLSWINYDATVHGDIQTFRIYYETSAFTDVSALTARASVGAGTYSYSVQDLNSGTTYWFAVVAVDRMGNFNPIVTPVSAVPTDTLAPGDVTNLSVESFADRLVFGWQAPSNPQTDMSGYKIYFNGSATPELLPSDANSYERSGLAPSGAYAFKITSYDTSNNESTGAATTGYTWLNNPANLTAEPYSGYVQLSWSPVAPAANVKHYAVYVSPSGAFSSVQGMTPVLTTTATQIKVAGLTNHQLYHFAVAAVNRSNGLRPEVTSVSAEPTPDESGPEITDVRIDGQPLVSGYTVTRTAALTLGATDQSGVSRIEVLLDGAPLSVDYSAPYACSIDILQVTDGAHVLGITAYDTLNNSASISYNLNIALAPPPAPVITAPANGLVTNQALITVQGQAEKQSQVHLFLNGQESGSATAVDSQGRFTMTGTLAEGANQIQAAAGNRAGTGLLSSAVVVTLDSTIPKKPNNLTAQSKESGQVRLVWQAPIDTSIEGYNVYRHDSPFATASAATKVNTSLVTGATFTDLPDVDGTWYYRVATVDAAQNESELSNDASAESDRQAPRAGEIVYTPQGNVDPVTGAVAPGRVDVSLTVSEPLMAVPFLSITPQGGAPINVNLVQNSPTAFSGSFTVLTTTPSGTAYAVFSGRDKVGNRGTEIDSGLSIMLDTAGPAVRRIALSPAAPIKNDAQAPADISVTIGLTEAVKAGTAPQLNYELSGPGRTPWSITNLVEIPVTSGDAQTWQGNFQLPADGGQAQVENMQFSHQSEDSLGNISDKVLVPNHFQVYQGDLPPLDVPSGLTAKALPGGRIDLSWNAVAEAVGYLLYRQGPDEVELTFFARIDGSTTFQDATFLDGTYLYAIASLRDENGQEAESGLSSSVTVVSDSQAPSAPQNLSLELMGQGIKAQWEITSSEDVTYNLYRTDAPEIISLYGLSPVQTQIVENRATDYQPSPNEHTYAVTAVDKAGNESAPSNSVYLNFSLLPVNNITVEQNDIEKPVVLWSHPGGSVVGYDVYMGPVGKAVKVNGAPVTDLSMADNGYDGEVREYTIIAKDANDVESPAHSIQLPKISFECNTHKPLRRGIMNVVEYTVTNLSDPAVQHIQLVANLNNIDHRSKSFTLEANETRTVPVVIGGYAELLDVEPLTSSLQISNGQDNVRIVRHSEIQVTEGMLVLQIYSEEFIRGGTGKVWFTLKNTGDADIDIITALSDGKKPSNDIEFALVDADGNILSTTNYQQAVGESVMTLSNRETIARIPAGETFTSVPVSIPVPEATPSNATVSMKIANLYYHRDIERVTMRGFSGNHAVVLSVTSYVGEIDTITPAASTRYEDIVITGRAALRDTGEPMPDAPLNLVITLDGFERISQVVTDSAGEFSYTFKPIEGESGLYSVCAVHPDLLSRPQQGQFVVSRVTAVPSRIRLNLPRNYEKELNIRIQTGEGTDVNNLRLGYDAWDQPTGVLPEGVRVDLGPAVAELGSEASADLKFVISGDNTAKEATTIVLRIISDESGVEPWGTITVQAQFVDPHPALAAEPNLVETGVVLGGTAAEQITLENKGLADLTGLTLSLVDQNGQSVPNWVLLNTPANLETLAVGEQQQVGLTFAPGSGVTAGFYSFYLHMEATNYPAADLGIYVSVTESGIGNVLFKASDIYTGTLTEKNELVQGLADAKITIEDPRNPVISYESTTDSFGEALITNLPAGNYKYRIRALNHQEKTGSFWIKPGITTTEDVFLDYNLVTVEWSVKEITIQDQYSVVLNATYETNVPAPVVILDPMSINLPEMQPGDVFNGQFTLTNYGLIRAENLEFQLPESDEYYQYEFLVALPEYLDAKERITIPYRITCLSSLQNEAGDGTGGSTYYPCGSRYSCYWKSWIVGYGFRCYNGIWKKEAVSAYFYGPCKYLGEQYCVGGYPYVWEGLPGVGGWHNPYHPPLEPLPSEGRVRACAPKPTCKGKCCDGGSTGGGSEEPKCGECEKLQRDDCGKERCVAVGSSVMALTGEYMTGSTDLSVKVQSGMLKVVRSYFDGQWHWNFNSALKLQYRQPAPDETPSILDPDAIDYNGVIYKREGSVYVFNNYRITIEARDSDGRPTSYRYEDKTGHWELFAHAIEDESGPRMGITAFGDRNGVIGRILYDADHRVASLADRHDEQLIWFEYNADGLVSAARDNENRQVQYNYTNGNLTHITDLLNGESVYDYDGNGHITKYIDPVGNEETITYGGDSMVTSVKDQNDVGHTFEYDYDDQTQEFYTQVRSPNGMIKEIWYDSNGYLRRVDINGKTEKSVEKDGRNTLATGSDGNQTKKEYDEWNNLKRIIYPDGSTESFEYDPVLKKKIRYTNGNGVTTEYAYDQNGNLIRQVDAAGTADERVTEYTYDLDGNMLSTKILGDANTAEAATTMIYDDFGNLLNQTDPEGHTTVFTYDVMGNVLTRQDARGKTWTYTYDAAGHLTSTTDPLQNVATYEYDDAGNKVRQVDPQGRVTLFAYDEHNNLIQTTLVLDPDDESKNIVSRTEYNLDNKPTRRIDPDGKETYYEYDSEGRLTKSIDGNGNEISQHYGDVAGGCSTCGSSAAAAGQISRIDYPTYAKEFRYDLRGRKTGERDILSATDAYYTTLNYDEAGNLVARTDKEERTTSYRYNSLNRLSKVIDPAGSETTYLYDDRGNMISLTDAENQTTRFEYDRNNRLVKEIRPLGQQITYSYDEAGNLIKRVDAKDQMTEYVYDAAGRMTEIRYYAAGDHTTAIKTVAFTYDAAGKLTGYDDGTTSAAYDYDDAYRKISETVTYPGFTKTNSYTYYKNGLKQTYTGPDNITYGYLYDANNQLSGVQIPNVGMFTINEYDWTRPAQETLPGGTTRRYGYDPLMRVAEISTSDPGGNDQLNYQYTYDKINNIIAKATEHGDYSYSYDDLYRLIDSDNPDQADESFEYDGVGNRLSSVETGGNWNYNANNELEGYDNITFQYDANGNLIEKNDNGVVTNFFYNIEGRLERVEDGSGNIIASYYYDPFGRRLWKETGGTRTYFCYNDEGLVGESNEAGSEIKTYGWKIGSTWSTDPLFMKIGSEYYWYHNDHLGTPQMLTATSGAVVWSARYNSFGSAAIDAASTLTNNLRFAGQYYDTETGLHYNRHRYYDPKLGRYLRSDPIGLAGGMNLYSYGKANPINNNDPSGLSSCGQCKIKGCCHCEKGVITRSRETGETRVDTVWHWDVIIQQQVNTGGSALFSWVSPLPTPPPTPHEAIIGINYFESEWIKETCTRERCLDFLTFELYYDCKSIKNSNYWVVNSTEDIKRTYWY